MGIMRLPCFSDYFASHPLLSCGLNHVLSRNKHQLINSFLHLADNNDPVVQADALGKIKKFHSILNDNYEKYYSPSNYMTIDEGMTPFKGN